MGKWIVRAVLIGVIGFASYRGYITYRNGYFSLPEFNETSYTITFKDGFRAIVVDPEVANPLESSPLFFRRLTRANPDRQYLGLPMDVPSWFEETWSYCYPPTDQERLAVESDMPEELRRDMIGARFDAVCKIDVDGQSLWRGLIYSVPKQ